MYWVRRSPTSTANEQQMPDWRFPTETKPAPAIDINNVDVAVDFFEEEKNTSQHVTWKAETTQAEDTTKSSAKASATVNTTTSTEQVENKTGHLSSADGNTTKCDNWYSFVV